MVEDQQIVAFAAVKEVATGAALAVQEVIICPAIEVVYPRAALQMVVVGAAKQLISAITAVQGVVATATVEHMAFGGIAGAQVNDIIGRAAKYEVDGISPRADIQIMNAECIGNSTAYVEGNTSSVRGGVSIIGRGEQEPIVQGGS